jgi:hypothetical protein
MVPLLIPTPLTFLGGTFYSTSVLPPFLAHRHAVQPAGLFDLGFPLELFRCRRRPCRTERGHHAWISRTAHGDRFLVLQDRLSAEELGRVTASPKRRFSEYFGWR